MNKKIPTVPLYRFLLHATQILKNPLPFHHKNFSERGDTFKLKIGFKKTVIFSRDAGFAEYALQKNQRNYYKSPIQTKDVAKYVGHGLLTSNGEHWRKQRRLIQPAFHKKQLLNILDSVNIAIAAEMDKIVPEKIIDVFPIFNDLAFQTVVQSLFSGVVSKEEMDKLQFITQANQKMLVKELRQPFLHWWFNWSGKIQKHLDLSQQARTILKHIVSERKASSARYNDLLDMLLDARYEDGSAMGEEQLLDEILILFTAGHETTSNSLSFTLQLLAHHPESQQQVFAEVKKAKDKSDSLFEFIQNCRYTQQVIEESMRLYPPAYFIDRINLEDDEYKGVQIPKNSSLLFSFFEIHRNPDYWRDPEEFDPSRFENGKNHSIHYAPFGAGPRKCIGNNFAMYEMILAVAEVVSRYEVFPVLDHIEIKPLITLKPKDAFLKFKSRNK